MKPRVLINTAAWGRKNVDLFANYSLASLLTPANIGVLRETHDVTVHIVTSRADHSRLIAHPMVALCESQCEVIWDFIPERVRVPTDKEGAKYSFLSSLQNIGIKKSLDHQAIVFNYADFIWAAESLPRSVAMLGDAADAVLAFCPPVDSSRGATAVDGQHRNADGLIDVSPRDLARVCIDCMHHEVTYRFWDAPVFTSLPSYLMFKVPGQGVVARTYHQTALVMRVKPDDPAYRAGITNGTLDGNFTGEVARRGRVVHVTDSDYICGISLHDGIVDSRVKNGNREQILKRFVDTGVTAEQRKFAETALRFRTADGGEGEWLAVEKMSGEIVSRYNSQHQL